MGPLSIAMAALGLWILDLISTRRGDPRTSLRELWDTSRASPSGLCLVAGITWFVLMAVPTTAIMLVFASLAGAGVDLRWWGWLPALSLSAAVVGFAVNGLRELVSDDATPTLAADVLIVVLVLASTATIVGLQQTALG
jgi:succinate dehydrogenase hydrophobic anchor subunit